MNKVVNVFLGRVPCYTVRTSQLCAGRFYGTAGNDPKIPKNVIEHLNTAQEQQTNGVVYDKKPFRIELEEGKRYSWCLCGRSKGQPLCDGTHKLVQYKITQRYVVHCAAALMVMVMIPCARIILNATLHFFSPIRFQVEKSGTYWLCNCKQTKNRPFCDGTHKCEEVQKTAGK
uniref:Iron-binding zinc finger CDGSH type domain-containing protein n=1 Tax=Anopheles melas TaxID=34690 RepID=A0A182UB40_9DIPT